MCFFFAFGGGGGCGWVVLAALKFALQESNFDKQKKKVREVNGLELERQRIPSKYRP